MDASQLESLKLEIASLRGERLELWQTIDSLLDVAGNPEYFVDDTCPFCEVEAEYEPGERFPHEADCIVGRALDLVSRRRSVFGLAH
jgi:hypothetical protein